MDSRQLGSAIADFSRAISLGEDLPASDPLHDLIISQALVERATAFAKLGDRETAVRDYKECTSRFSKWCQALPNPDPDLTAALSNGNSTGNAAPANEGADRTFICRFMASQEPWIITVSPRRKAFRAEFSTATYHTRCTLEWVDGRRGTTLVKSEGFGPGCNILTIPADDQVQHVQFSTTGVTVSLMVNGQTTGGMNIDYSTGIARSSTGATGRCRDAHP